MRNKLTIEDIDKILRDTVFEVLTVFDKQTVVTALLPNGFTITETSGCVDPANYDLEIGIEICKRKITDRIWHLEGYLLQQELHNASKL